KRFWRAFKDVATVFSFIFNFVVLVLLLLFARPGVDALFAVRSGLVEPLLDDLDAAFVGLGEATVETEVQIDEPVVIAFDLPLDQPMPIQFDLPIEQDINVVLTNDVPLRNMPAQFNLPAGGGSINGAVSLSLPRGLVLPVRLEMLVPVSQTISVRLNVPVSETVPVRMVVPVQIALGDAGLDPAVEELRAVFWPLRDQLDSLPDGVELP
ncbi:MAG: hypothetical protein GX620_18475, partial [Chloroflexi bacterium]|nr:hypothetical protein [Chloroflexota bacterium]